jgi:hypothetical protein
MENYEQFENRMAEKYPRYFGSEHRFGGFAINEGWYHIIENLIAEIDSYTKWRRNMRAYELRVDRAKKKGREAVLKFISRGKERLIWEEERADDIMEIPQRITERVEYIKVVQIKEKFGGLRFYYDGGDDRIDGMVRMAELWAGVTCEKCGNRGTRRQGGWIRTLCDEHEAEHQEKLANWKSEDE